MGEQLTAGERVVRVSGASGGWGGSGDGVIVRIIPAHEDKYPPRWVEAKALVAWPAPHRLGGDGWNYTTVLISALARPDEVGTCAKCGRHRRLYPTGSERQCGTCIHREERRINTREMYGRGRRGY